jgi:hypothetical protein
MNTAVVGPSRTASAFLTLGAGARLEVSSRLSFHRLNEATEEGPAAEVYARRIGPAPHAAWLVCPDFAQVAQPGAGALGKAVRDRGGQVALLLVGRRPPAQRLGALVAMDDHGVVPEGAEIKPEALPAVVARSFLHAALLIVDLDPALDGAETIASLLPAVDPDLDTLLALAPSPLPRDGPWDRLTPVVAWGRGVRPGVLTSATTHTPGLIANIDIAPTIMARIPASPSPRIGRGGGHPPRHWSEGWEGVRAASPQSRGARAVPVHTPLAGNPARVTSGPGPSDLLRMSRQITLHRHALFPVLGGAGALMILVLGLIIAALVGPRQPRLIRVSRAALVACAAFPVALLFAPMLGATTLNGYACAVAASTGILTFLASLLARRLAVIPPLLLAFLAMDAILILDLALGARWIAGSLLSDFPLAGFRFYGIGNEYAALLIGTTAVAAFWLRESCTVPRSAMLAWGLVLFLVGHPALGANFGEALTATAAFGVGLALWEGRRRLQPIRLVASLAAALVLCATLLFLIDAARPPAERTHLGQLAAKMAGEGPLGGALLLGQVAGRKWSMNMRILTSTPFVAVLVAVAPLLALWYHKAGPAVVRELATRPMLKNGMAAALAGGLVGFLVNDSGAVVWGLVTAAPLAALLDVMLAAREAPG